MRTLYPALSRAIALSAVLFILGNGRIALAQTPAPLTYPPPLITLAEARAIIEGAVAYASEANIRMAVVVVDHAGNVVSSDRMDGAGLQNIRFAEAKAFASALYRQTTEALGELYKTRPDRYFGIINMYPGKVYLVGGGVPLALDGVLVGGVGVAGLPQGIDEKSARAGIESWMKFRATMKK
jgi:corrinoid adenosyltransferase